MEPKALYFTAFGFRKRNGSDARAAASSGYPTLGLEPEADHGPQKNQATYTTPYVVIQAETHSTRANSLEGTMLPITARDAALFYLLESAKLLKLKSTDDDGFGNYYCLSGLI